MLDCAVSCPDPVGDLVHGRTRFDDGAALNSGTGKQAAGLRRVDALARGALLWNSPWIT